MSSADPEALLKALWNDIAAANPLWTDVRVTAPLPDRVPLDGSTVLTQYAFAYRHASMMHALMASKPFACVRFTLTTDATPQVELLCGELEDLSPQGIFPIQQSHMDIMSTGSRLMHLLHRACAGQLDDAEAASLAEWYGLQYRIHGVSLYAVQANHAEFTRWITYHCKWPRKVAPVDPTPVLPVPIRVELRPDPVAPIDGSKNDATFVVLVIAEVSEHRPLAPIAERAPLPKSGADFEQARDRALATVTDESKRAGLAEVWRRIGLLAAAEHPGTNVEVLNASADELAGDFANAGAVSDSGLSRHIRSLEQPSARPYGAIVVGADFFALADVAAALGEVAQTNHLIILADGSNAKSDALSSFRQTGHARSILSCADADEPFKVAAAMMQSHSRYGLPAFPALEGAAEYTWTFFESAFGARHAFATHLLLDALARYCLTLCIHRRSGGKTDPHEFSAALMEGFRATMSGGRDFEVWIEDTQPMYAADRSVWGSRIQLAVSFLTHSGKTTGETRWLVVAY